MLETDQLSLCAPKQNATPTQIKAAFRGLSRVWHPDKVKSDLREEADAKMSEINKAYET